MLVHHPELDYNPRSGEYEWAAGFLTYSGFEGFVPIIHSRIDVPRETYDLFVHENIYYLYARNMQTIWKILPPATLEAIIDSFTNVNSYPRLESMGYNIQRGIKCLLQLRESGIGIDAVPDD